MRASLANGERVERSGDEGLDKEDCLSIVREIFSRNHFVQHSGIVIDEVECGFARLHMDIRECHTNPAGFVHGGAFSTLANTAVGVACCTVGARTVTLNITTDFIGNVREGSVATAEARVLHRGRRTVILSAKIADESGRLLCQTMASMFIKSEDDVIPARW